MMRPVSESGTTNNPVKLGGDHFIVPVCGTCGREIDKDGSQWRHVGDHVEQWGPTR